MAYNVLVVDDSSSIRAIVKKIIKMSGFAVAEFKDAADGVEALSVLNSQPVDVVLTDINMPNMDGMTLITEMKQNPALAAIPVVVVSTEGSERKINDAMAMGAVGYVKKPFVAKDIKQTLDAIMMGAGDGSAGFDEDDDTLDF